MNLGPYNLRPRQVRAVEALRETIARLRRQQPTGPLFVLLQGPCGFGKTLVSSAITRLTLDKGRSVLFLAARRLLIDQKSRKLSECEIDHAVLMAGQNYDRNQRAVVCSKDTLVSRAMRSNVIEFPEADVVLIDEAHEGTGETWRQIIEQYPSGVFIGLTATPAKGNGKALPLYQEIVKGATYAELLDEGFLVPAVVYAPFVVDMEGVDVNAENGEYVKEQVVERFTDDALIGDVIRDWCRYAENRLTAVYGASVDHSIYLAKQFTAAGIPAAHVDAGTEPGEREETLRRLEAGEIRVLCNYEVYTTGADFPYIECVQIVRAMRSLNTYLQVVGRGFRPHTFPDGRVKRDCVVIDHGGNVHRHGWPTEDHEWSLDPATTVEQRDREKKPPGEPKTITCPICGATRKKGPKCVECGHEHTRDGTKVRMRDGELKPLKEKATKAKRLQSDDQKAWVACLSIAFHKGLTVKQARIIFHRRKGYWPSDDLMPQIESYKNDLKVPVLYPNWGRPKKEEATNARDDRGVPQTT